MTCTGGRPRRPVGPTHQSTRFPPWDASHADTFWLWLRGYRRGQSDAQALPPQGSSSRSTPYLPGEGESRRTQTIGHCTLLISSFLSYTFIHQRTKLSLFTLPGRKVHIYGKEYCPAQGEASARGEHVRTLSAYSGTSLSAKT